MRRVDNGEFLEYATVYGNYYGTLRSAVQQELAEGRNVLLEIDTDGARQIKKLMPEAELILESLRTPDIDPQ